MASPAPEQTAGARLSIYFGCVLAFGLFPAALLQFDALPLPVDVGPWRLFHVWTLLVLIQALVARQKITMPVMPWPAVAFLAGLLALQAVAVYAGAVRFGADVVAMIGLYGHLLREAGLLLLAAVAVRLVCGLSGGTTWLVRGAALSLVILLAVCGMQVCRLLSSPEMTDHLAVWIGLPAGAAELTGRAHDLLNAGLGFISRWLAPPTLQLAPGWRVTGLFDTPGSLALVLSAVYVPLVLGLDAEAGPWGRRVNTVLTTGVAVALAATRLIPALAACLILVGVRLYRRAVGGQRLRAVFGLLCLLGAATAVLASDDANRRFARHVLDRVTLTESRNQPGEVAARELWRVFLEHPWTGAGYGWSSSYVIGGETYGAAADAGGPELRAWREAADVPTPALLLEFLAVFGIFPALGIAASLGWLWRRLRRLPRSESSAPPRSKEARCAFAASAPYIAVVTLFALCDSDMANPFLSLPFFVLWAVVGSGERTDSKGSKVAEGKTAPPSPPPGPSDLKPSASQPPPPVISNSSSRPFTPSAG